MRLALLCAVVVGCSKQPSAHVNPLCEEVSYEPSVRAWTGEAGPLSLKIIQSNPEEVMSGLNTWTVSVGGAGPGAEVSVTPFMPIHGHGLSPVEYTAAVSDEGEAVIPAFDLIMPGPWEFTFDVADEGQTHTTIVTFCAGG